MALGADSAINTVQGGIPVIFWLNAIALLFVLIYFFYLGKRQNDSRTSRHRYRRKRESAQPEQLIDPIFQFDQPPDHAEEEKPVDPN
jgi:hypothetical protein